MSEAATAAGFSRLFSDERLTRRAVGGDQRAFAAIFSRYHQPLYRFCLAIVGNPDDAQEALQNTMAKVLRALPGEEREIELKPWLYRIAHNESIDLLRRRRETRELDVEQVAPGYGLAEDVATRERLRRLLDDLRELPERQREVLVMRELSGLDFEEVGSALGTSGAVARQTLYEARQNLRQMEDGREMSCDVVTRALSDGDGRVARRRAIRSHLRSCAACRQFRDEIEGRQRDLAALAPLPAAAAIGMLHGLLGGSSQGATGGGLAATLGGGAAKTIGASAVAKGVATAAVVAALGVTAADKSGVIHLGLPGDRSSQSSSATSGRSDSGSAGAPVDAGKAGASGSQAGGKAEAGTGAKGASAAAKGRGRGQAQANQHGKATTTGSATERPHGRHHEKQYPAAAEKGQETAAAHAPAQRGGEGRGNSGGGNGNGGGGQATPPKSSKAPSSPPKGPPSSPPAASPESSRPPAPSSGAEVVSPGGSAGAETPSGSGNAAEKKP